MKIDEIPTVVYGLKEDDIELLKALVHSPVYTVLKKIYSDAIITQYSQMESAKEIKDIFNLQGRINGLRYAQNAPRLLLDNHLRFQETKKKSEEKFKRGGGLRPDGQ